MHGAGRRTPSIVKRGVSLAPQGDHIFPGLSVRENLDSGAYSGKAWRERKKRRDRVLADLPAARERCSTRASARCPAASGAWSPSAARS